MKYNAENIIITNQVEEILRNKCSLLDVSKTILNTNQKINIRQLKFDLLEVVKFTMYELNI